MLLPLVYHPLYFSQHGIFRCFFKNFAAVGFASSLNIISLGFATVFFWQTASAGSIALSASKNLAQRASVSRKMDVTLLIVRMPSSRNRLI